MMLLYSGQSSLRFGSGLISGLVLSVVSWSKTIHEIHEISRRKLSVVSCDLVDRLFIL